jgi:hypothetical protein
LHDDDDNRQGQADDALHALTGCESAARP